MRRIARPAAVGPLLLLLALASVARAGPDDVRSADLDAASRPGQGAEEIVRAIDLFARNDFDASLDALKEAVKKNPGLFPPKILLAKLFLLRDRLAAGRALLEEAVAEDPDQPETYLLFGWIALRERRIADAELHFGKAEALTRSGSWGDERRRMFLRGYSSGLAEVAERRRKWAIAREHLQLLTVADPLDASACQRLGRVLFHLGLHEDASRELDRAARLDPRQESAAIGMARLFAGRGDLDRARGWIARGEQADPKGVRIRLAAGELLLQLGSRAEAEAEAEAIARIDPEARELKALRGLLAWTAGDYPEAERHFRRLYDETPGDFAASNNLALALLEQPDPARQRRGKELALANARAHPRMGEALSTLGWACYKEGRPQEAEPLLREAMATGTAGADTAYYLARILMDQQRPDEARTMLETALRAGGLFSYRRDAESCLEKLKK